MSDRPSERWYVRQRERDLEARGRSESLLGPERAIFAEMMGLTANCLDAVFAGGRFDDLPSRRMIEFGNHAFNLLWSAWDEALAGRYDASRGHVRSIGESCEFLMALIADPQIADRLGDSTKDVYLARRVVKDALERGEPGAGRAHFDVMKKAHDDVQALSHVCNRAISEALPLLNVGGQTIGVVRPGGATSQIALRLVAIPLAGSAAQLFGILSGGLAEAADIEEDLWRRAVRRAETLADELSSELGTMGTMAPMQTLYFARSDEEL